MLLIVISDLFTGAKALMIIAITLTCCHRSRTMFVNMKLAEIHADRQWG
jgi:hypothetical protein